MLKKNIIPITLLYTITLAIGSLIKLNDLPNLGISYVDKICHFIAYSILTLLWYKTYLYTIKLTKNKAVIYTIITCVVFGIIIEVLQETLTTTRTLDGYDIVANVIGVLLAVITIRFQNLLQVKNN